MSHTIIVGGGIAGLTAAWQLHQLGRSFTLYEAANRLGGTVRTVHREGFTIELGPDGWVTEKPWAAELAQELARALGHADELTPSLDEGRVTWILRNGKLLPIPDGMRMMVPANLAALENSPLLSPEAVAAYHAEPHRAAELREHALKAGAHHHPDESVADFVLRHFGNEVLQTLAAPLLSGVFGGDVQTLSVRAVMPAFVQMEREHGSLILALQAKNRPDRAAQHTIFTTLRTGTQTLIDRMAATLPEGSIHLNTSMQDLADLPTHDHLILATPAPVTRRLLTGSHPELAGLIDLESSSAILVAFAFNECFDLPKGFGFLIPQGEDSRLLAATFVDQKFPHRAPPGKRLLRAFFGGPDALNMAPQDDKSLATLALTELQKVLGPIPTPLFSIVQRWPQSLPQYAVGHQDRIAHLTTLLPPNLHLLGNPYKGVGLPDLIREARQTARLIP